MIYIILMLVVAVALIVMITTTQSQQSQLAAQRRRSLGGGGVDRDFVQRKWDMIEVMVRGGGSLRDAVSEADKLLDYGLRNTGARGTTMGERLKDSRSRFSDIDAIWSAHKVRNALAHEADFDLVPSQAKEAVASFKQGLKDLGVL